MPETMKKQERLDTGGGAVGDVGSCQGSGFSPAILDRID
jgi:hypothetical protein